MDTNTDRKTDFDMDGNTDRDMDHGHRQLEQTTLKKNMSVENVQFNKMLKILILDADVIFKFKNKSSSVTLTFKNEK